MSTFAKVLRLFHRDHLSISEIQRRTSLSRNTIKAWLKETSPDGYKSKGRGSWNMYKIRDSYGSNDLKTNTRSKMKANNQTPRMAFTVLLGGVLA